MKKYLKLLLAMLVFASCQKEKREEAPTGRLTEDQRRIKEEVNLEVQMAGYALLDESERRNLWLDQLSDALAMLTLTTAQDDLLLQGYNLIRSGEYLDEQSSEMAIWTAQVSSAFSLKQQYIVFSTLGKISSGAITDAEFLSDQPRDIGADHINGGPTPDCHCATAQGHDFCGTLNHGGVGGAYIHN